MEWMLMPLRRYVDFEGRSRRMEFWMFFLLHILVYAFLLVLLAAAGFSDGEINSVGIVAVGLAVLIWLGTFIPWIAVIVRRFHDQNLSGFFYFLSWIPSIGFLVLIVFMIIPGTAGENRFGEDPLDPSGGTFDLESTFR